MTDTALQETWRKRLEGFDQSGMSASDWCEQKGITLDRFYHWRKRFRMDHSRAPQPDGWAVVEVVGPARATGASQTIAVRVGAAIIDVQPGFDPEHLRAIVGALEKPRC